MKVALIGPSKAFVRLSFHRGGVASHIDSLLDEFTDWYLIPAGKAFFRTRKMRLDGGVRIFRQVVATLWSSDFRMLSTKRKMVLLLFLIRNSRVPFKSFDLIHIHGQFYFLGKFIRYIIGYKGKLNLTIHSYNSATDDFEHWLECFDRIFNVSKADQEKGAHLNFKFASRVLFNPISIRPFQPTDRTFDFLFVGSLTKAKGLELVLQTFQDNKYRLAVAGVGPMKDEVQKQEDKQENIEYLGYIEPFEYYKKAKCLVVPSHSESFGLVYLDALSQGCSVIGYGPTVREFRSMLKTERLIPFDYEEDGNVNLMNFKEAISVAIAQTEQLTEKEVRETNRLLQKYFSFETYEESIIASI